MNTKKIIVVGALIAFMGGVQVWGSFQDKPRIYNGPNVLPTSNMTEFVVKNTASLVDAIKANNLDVVRAIVNGGVVSCEYMMSHGVSRRVWDDANVGLTDFKKRKMTDNEINNWETTRAEIVKAVAPLCYPKK